ncbi:TonB-dependent receptor plug domain-containing protein [Pelagicoccus sp. SDUM812005]|uniref:TonB-dependent receptor plug domain-containing protein n=1 Tax=Pelagicoccus sp. SDUM812005 TaxID=3041257 RepID=UPI00280FAF3A|nr:TonB-dependent receptor plug domain-containing protein [Pelagicoccus sp. SDUM812005]MDQ8181012.1 TonB-dependent receptor plug domain-containing protein [Pelagicoccus sp. SDUM812005]
MKKTPLLLLGAPLFATLPFYAQSDNEEETFELSPFVVSSNEDSGYMATSTLAGSRLRSSLQDVSASISVVTEEFMDDTGSTDAKSLLVYTVGTEIGGSGGNFSATGASSGFADERTSRTSATGRNRVRGLASADLTRNYFATDIPFDSYNTSRVEVNRGANSILFGLGSPAGIINNATEAAFYEDSHTVEAKVGSYGSVRGVIDINRVVLEDQLAIRIIGLEDRQKFQQDPAFENDSRLFLALDSKPFASTGGAFSKLSLRGNYEKGEIEANRPRITPPSDNITSWFDPWDPSSEPKFTFDPGNTPYGNRNSAEAEPMGGALRNPVVIYPDETSPIPADPAATAGQNIIGRQFVLSNWTFPSGTRTTAVHTGITRVGNALRQAGDPDWGFYQQPSLTDTSIFDFRNNLIDGPNKYEDSEFEAWNLTLEQLFLDNKVGIELAFDQQEMSNANGSLLGDDRNATIAIDNALTMIDGTPNANFGRPYVVNVPKMYYDEAERSAWRATAFYDLDLRDNTNNDLLGRLLGRHVLTGVLSEQTREAQSRYGATTYAGSEFTHGASSSIANGQGPRFGAIHYLGGSLANMDSPAGANIPRLYTERSLSAFNLTGNDAVFFLKEQGASAEAEVIPLNVFNNDRQLTIAPEDADFGRSEVESIALVSQSYFWDDLLVATLGWREDELTTYDAGPAPLHPQGSRIVDPDVYTLPTDSTFNDKSDTFSWGLAFHLPDSVTEKLSWIDRISLYYNDSSNFQPTTSRFNVYGERISSPQGKNVDKSIGLSMFENRLHIRATWYETDQVNVSEGTISTQIREIVNRQYVRLIETTRFGLNPDPNGDGIPFESGYVAPPQFLLDTFNVIRLPDGSATFSDPGNVVGVTESSSSGFELETVYNPNQRLSLVLNVAKQEAIRDNSGAALRKFYFEDAVGSNGESLYDNWTGPVGQGLVITQGGVTLAQQAESIANEIRSVVAQDGAIRQELREWRANAVANYRLNDTWNVGGAYRWQSESAIGYPITVAPNGDRIIDVANPFFGPNESNLDVWVGYQRPIMNDKVNWKIQLNIRNLLDEDDLVPTIAQPDGTHAIYRIPEERRWELSSNFTF